MEEQGAHLIDVGGESTRPGHKPVSEQEELNRVVPVVEAIAQEITIPISVDTYKSKVAKAAVQAGASIINDVWGAKKEPEIARLLQNIKLRLSSCIIVKIVTISL